MNKSMLKSAGMVLTTIAVLGVLSWVAFTPEGDLRGVVGTRADEGDVVIFQETELDNLLQKLSESIDADETTRIEIIQEVINTLRTAKEIEQ